MDPLEPGRKARAGALALLPVTPMVPSTAVIVGPRPAALPCSRLAEETGMIHVSQGSRDDGDIMLLKDHKQANAVIESRINALGRPLKILEAGCGRQWPLTLAVPYRLTGVDLDAVALTSRTDLHEAVIGDLRTVDLPASAFDVIYCSYVLEHVDGAEQVLKNFVRWLAPGGLLVVRVPDLDSAYGFATKHTPFRMHVWAHRYLMHRPNAGKPGFAPYPTVYDPVISESGMAQFCARSALASLEVFRCGSYARGTPLVYLCAAVLGIILRLPWRHNNLIFIGQRGGA